MFAIMACAVCLKKVLMENSLNVLGGNLGDFGGILHRSQAKCACCRLKGGPDA